MIPPETENMAPPRLHPRSRTTSSLFAPTLVLSFFVVALPHILPCPAPRVVVLADGAMVDANGRRRRRRNPEEAEPKNGIVHFGDMGDEKDVPAVSKRECPIPKPGGVVGELLGFTKVKPDIKPDKGRPTAESRQQSRTD